MLALDFMVSMILDQTQPGACCVASDLGLLNEAVKSCQLYALRKATFLLHFPDGHVRQWNAAQKFFFSNQHWMFWRLTRFPCFSENLTMQPVVDLLLDPPDSSS